MPDRFGLDLNRDGLFDYDYSLEFINPSAWAVNFDACASTPGSSPIVLYEWDLAGLTTVSAPTFAARDASGDRGRARRSASEPV